MEALSQSETTTIAPNPFSNQLDIRSELFDEVKITDIAGRVFYQTKLPAASTSLRVNTASFSPGMYVVVVGRSGKIIHRSKITKL